MLGRYTPIEVVPSQLPAPVGTDTVYIGQLTGFPFPVGGANIYKVNSNSDLHNNYPEPNILVGGGNGKMKLGGQHLVLPEKTPIANLHLTLLQKVGVERDKFGDSTGTIAEI